MTINLMDIDVEYKVQTDYTAEGTPIVKICPNTSLKDRDNDNYDICLEKVDVEELIRVLTFIKEEL